MAGAAVGGVAGKGAGEQSLARGLYRRLDPRWLLIADRNFHNWQNWRAAAGTGAALLAQCQPENITDLAHTGAGSRPRSHPSD